MAIDKNSNAFTFGFAIVMVIVVGTALSFASLALKPRQVENRIQKDMISILNSVGVEASRKEAEELFYKNITKRMTLNYNGDVIETRDGKIDPLDLSEPFNVDIQKEHRNSELKPENRNYPLYIANVNGEEIAIIPLVGKGLWGPIWGYVSVEKDYNTIYGATFNHKSETPGLGAEISESFFQTPFRGKKIYDENGNLVSIDIKKGGADPSNLHEVDGITGGTITSNGVDEMLSRTFGIYDRYFKQVNNQSNSL